ncbi:MAG: ATP-dependent DNA ligase [bacterium]|nr:MAG: ATP-dependent DNA ligase [bacterium]
MLFSKFSEYLQKLEKTSSRLEITAILKELFKETDEKEIKEVVYLSLGVLAPNYESKLLNFAEKMVARSIAISYGKNLDEVTRIYKETGDLGNVAESLSVEGGGLQSEKLTVNQVFSKLVEIAKDNGEGSQDRKIEKFAELLKSLDSLSVRYVARIPVGKLRLGFSEKTIIDALSSGDKEKSKNIENAYNIRPDIGYIAELVKLQKVKEAKPKIGVPVVPMLCQRIGSYDDIIKKMGEVAVEPKFDGLRIFIHYRKKDNFTAVFTRNMNSLDINIFPELKNLAKYIKADEIILDTEAVGLDSKREGFVDFQKTIARRRKHEVEKSSTETPLQFQVFDCLFVNDRSLINTPYQERRKELEKHVVNGGLLRIDESLITKDPEVVKSLHNKYLKMGLEGVVVKKVNGYYVSGRTGWNWVKMKEEEGQSGRLSDTLDCIVMGYFTGKGKRAQFGLGKILVGIKDGDSIRTLTKVGTGLTEVMLVEIRKRLDNLESKEKPKDYEAQKDLIPDVWAIPKLVVEVTADSISKSTKHSLGLSLRFPRFIKIREDKGPNEATTLKELKEISKLQN